MKFLYENFLQFYLLALTSITQHKNNLSHFIFDTFIKHSDTFIKSENDLGNIWDNQYYWRQKQAYEELITEIL